MMVVEGPNPKLLKDTSEAPQIYVGFQDVAGLWVLSFICDHQRILGFGCFDFIIHPKPKPKILNL